MADNPEAGPKDASPAQHATTPDWVVGNALASSETQWIMQALNRLDERLGGIEKRLRRLEISIAVALGFVLCTGFAIGLISRMVSFDFKIAILPVS